MNWEDERYVRVYTRDTTEWIILGWEGQCLLMQLLRKADRAGVVSMGRHGVRGLAALLRMPQEIVTKGLESLLEDGCIEQHGDSLVIRNFIEAQEAQTSPRQRQREYRERERDAIRAGLPKASQKGCVIYFIQSEHGGHIKIGRADDLATRLAGLQTGRPDKLVVLASAPGTREDERRVHEFLAAHRERGEWFRDSAAVLDLVARVTRDGSNVWVTISGDAASPEMSPEASPVTPYRTVPSVPSNSDPAAASPSASAAPLALEHPSSEKPAASKRAKPKPDQEGRTTPAWNAFRENFLERYRFEPLPRDAGTSSGLARLVDKFGKDAPAVAAFYVWFDREDGFYRKQKHPVGLLTSKDQMHTIGTAWRQHGEPKVGEFKGTPNQPVRVAPPEQPKPPSHYLFEDTPVVLEMRRRRAAQQAREQAQTREEPGNATP